MDKINLLFYFLSYTLASVIISLHIKHSMGVCLTNMLVYKLVFNYHSLQLCEAFAKRTDLKIESVTLLVKLRTFKVNGF